MRAAEHWNVCELDSQAAYFSDELIHVGQDLSAGEVQIGSDQRKLERSVRVQDDGESSSLLVSRTLTCSWTASLSMSAWLRLLMSSLVHAK